jgi:hypothetical protein
MQLPTKPIPARTQNPGCLVVYSTPKTGKTTVLSLLDNCLILDYEDGTKSLDSVAVNIIGLAKPINEAPEVEKKRHEYKDENGIARPKYYMSEVIAELKKNNPYKYIAMDTITKYEDMCVYDATIAYMKSPIGKNFNRWDEEDFRLSGGKKQVGQLKPKDQWDTVLALPRGAGYWWLRESYEKYIEELKLLGCYIILCAHIKTSQITNKKGTEVEGKDLNLTGKIKDSTSALIADSIGYLYREGNKNFISFQPSDEVKSGSRSKHLSGKIILLSERGENGKITSYWNNIYL